MIAQPLIDQVYSWQGLFERVAGWKNDMLIKLHSQATTTPKVRAVFQASDEPAWVLAERHGTTEQTVWKWRKRDSVEDRSHTPHR